MRVTGKTDIGRMRQENQDNYRYGSVPGSSAWGIVCDGMGGAQHGKLASTLAVDTMEAQFFSALQGGIEDEDIPDMMIDALQAANKEVYARSGNGRVVMGTTAVCAVVKAGRLHVAHAGDSRAYLFENGVLRQITRDHSMVQELVEQGAISQEAANHHPEKNVITRALGVEASLEAEYGVHSIEQGSLVLLCTDGLSNMVPEGRIIEILNQTEFYALADALVEEALAAGGSDNITVLLIGEGDETVG